MMKRISEHYLFVSSLFYFRIPETDWLDRLQKVKAAGYNAIDVYIPWNFHEPTRGDYRFTNGADVGKFLDMAGDIGLMVIARPGPYICSEWDGGALPYWLNTDTSLKFRQNDERWLAEVARWYDVVLPIILPRQATNGGSVIAVQVENELDFYPCADPKGYIESLYHMARARGVTVPITACIGQGDIQGATGESDLVIPMVNIYPSSPDDPALDVKLDEYVAYAKAHGFVPMTMETNRDILTLSRLVGTGFIGISPYLMTSGVHMGPWSAINNWGAFPSYLTTDYDFGGMISADGTLRASFYEQRVLTSTVFALEEIFLKGTSESIEPLSLADRENKLTYRRLTSDMGNVTFAFNLTDEQVTEAVSVEGLNAQLIVPPKHYTTAFSDVRWTAPTDSTYHFSATSNLFYRHASGHQLVMLVAGHAGTGLLRVDADVPLSTSAGDGKVQCDESGVTVQFQHGCGATQLQFNDGTEITLITLSMHEAGHAWLVPETGWLIGPRYLRDADKLAKDTNEMVLDVGDESVRFIALSGAIREIPADHVLPSPGLPQVDWRGKSATVLQANMDKRTTSVNPPSMEQAGIGFKRAIYTATVEGQFDGLQCSGAADMIWVYANGVFEGSFAPGGRGFDCIFARAYQGTTKLELIVESWGHTNFHDENAPSLLTGAQKGITGTVTQLPAGEPIFNWGVAPVEFALSAQGAAEHNVQYPIACQAGGHFRLSGTLPIGAVKQGLYLVVSGENGRADVRLNGEDIGRIWFGPHLEPRMVGGRADRLWLRDDLLAVDETAEIEIDFFATADGYLGQPSVEQEDQWTKGNVTVQVAQLQTSRIS